MSGKARAVWPGHVMFSLRSLSPVLSPSLPLPFSLSLSVSAGRRRVGLAWLWGCCVFAGDRLAMISTWCSVRRLQHSSLSVPCPGRVLGALLLRLCRLARSHPACAPAWMHVFAVCSSL
jgi:hypothetical protein